LFEINPNEDIEKVVYPFAEIKNMKKIMTKINKKAAELTDAKESTEKRKTPVMEFEPRSPTGCIE
jgi:hypothetical protein